MDTTFLLPVLDEVFAAFGRGVMRGVNQELANPTAPTLPVAPATLPTRSGQRTSTARPAPAGLTSAPEVGAIVRYRQGRGAFEATVVSVDAGRSAATVRRTTDGREVVRPFSKLFAAGSSGGTQPQAQPAAAQETGATSTTGE